jgi:phosphoglycerate dehydrogenase-like enzyme
VAWKILVTAPYMLPVIDQFADIFAAHHIETVCAEVRERLEEEELLPLVGDIDGVICGDDRFTDRVMAAAPRLKVISKWGTGIDSIDGEAAAKRGIRVCRTPDAFTQPVADSVMGYILDFARRLPAMDHMMKTGLWEKIPGRALHECTLGVIGVGCIGGATVRRAHGFGMVLLGNDTAEMDAALVRETGLEMVSKEVLLQRADFVSIACDLNPTSHHLIGAAELSAMLPTAVLLNLARGPLVDEAALIRALQSGAIAGAALDVFEVEPLAQDSPLRRMENVMLAPHNSNSSPAAWERVHRTTLDNLIAGLNARS